MRRDRTPILIAAATAIASCGLLALSIWLGWLGPDVGRGAGDLWQGERAAQCQRGGDGKHEPRGTGPSGARRRTVKQ